MLLPSIMVPSSSIATAPTLKPEYGEYALSDAYKAILPKFLSSSDNSSGCADSTFTSIFKLSINKTPL